MNINTSTSSAASQGIPDPPALSKVRKNYSDLQELLHALPNKLSSVSSRIDEEFLSSYRVHMLSIQSELKKLKQDVTKGEQVLNSDVAVAKLEQEAKWFAEECNRLQMHHDAMQKDCDQMKERFRAMIEQKDFLANQLKALMKRNKILENELESLKHGDAQSIVSGWCRNTSKPNTGNTPFDTAKLMEHLPYQDAFPLPPETPYDYGNDNDSEFELPSIDLNDEEMNELLQSQKPYSAKSRRKAQDDNDEDVVLSPTGHPTVRPAPLKIPGSPKHQTRDHSPYSPTRSPSHTSLPTSPKGVKQQIIDSDGLLVQSILPPHHLRKPKMSFSLPNLVIANSKDFEESLYPSFAIDEEEDNNMHSQSVKFSNQVQQPGKKKKGAKKQANTMNGGGLSHSYSEPFARTTGGITGGGVFGNFSEAFKDSKVRISRSSSGARTPLSPSRRSYSGQSVQDIQGQRMDVELFLEDAIKEIYAEILERKQLANTTSSTRKLLDLRTTINLPSPTHRNSSSVSPPRSLSPTSARKVLSTPDLLYSRVNTAENVINQQDKLEEKTSFLGTRFGPIKHKVVTQKRRTSLNSSTQTSMLSAIQGVIRTEDDDHHLRIDPKIRLQGGLSKLGTDQFSENDRFATMVKFLSYPTVFALVVEALDKETNRKS